MLAAGSVDRILRVWDLQTTSPIAVLAAHTGMITSVNFCPSPRNDLKYLVTTSNDGSIAFWQYSTPRGQKITFAPKPIQYHEKLRPDGQGHGGVFDAKWSPDGTMIAATDSHGHILIFGLGVTADRYKILWLIARSSAGNGGGNQNSPPSARANHSQLDRMIEALATNQGREQALILIIVLIAVATRTMVIFLVTDRALRNMILDRRLSEQSSNQPRQGTTWGRPPAEQSHQPPVSQLKYVRRTIFVHEICPATKFKVNSLYGWSV
ncbi:Bromodomain and WD repeat-containing protein 1 [Eumeta japonica]|uniref:Bromodomain and WD repeat-containing protein 1 n=1 Tax=Eumeta variegata TaxID=151549 RepID=A0A4C1STV8_EUMVA|nr:Bromodomain and WD repeat-containing protein 1 [Eumeta japonica]